MWKFTANIIAFFHYFQDSNIKPWLHDTALQSFSSLLYSKLILWTTRLILGTIHLWNSMMGPFLAHVPQISSHLVLLEVLTHILFIVIVLWSKQRSGDEEELGAWLTFTVSVGTQLHPGSGPPSGSEQAWCSTPSPSFSFWLFKKKIGWCQVSKITLQYSYRGAPQSRQCLEELSHSQRTSVLC